MTPVPSLQNLCISNIWKQGNLKIQGELVKITNIRQDLLKKDTIEIQHDVRTRKYVDSLEQFILVILNEINKQNVMTKTTCSVESKNNFLEILNIELSLKNLNLEKQIASFKCNYYMDKEAFEATSENVEHARVEKNLSDCMSALRQVMYACHVLKNEKTNLQAKNEELRRTICKLGKEISQYKSLNVSDEVDLMEISDKLNAITISSTPQEGLENMRSELQHFQSKSSELGTLDQTCTSCDCVLMTDKLKNLEDEKNHIYKLYKTLLESNKKLTEELMFLKTECEHLSLENKSLAEVISNVRYVVVQSELDIKKIISIITESEENGFLDTDVTHMEYEKETEILNYSSDNAYDSESDNEFTTLNDMQELKNKLKEDVETAEKLKRDCEKLKQESLQLSSEMEENCHLENILQAKIQEISDQKQQITNLKLVNNMLQKKYIWAHEFCEKLVCECEMINLKKAKYKQSCKTFQHFAKTIESDIKAWNMEKRELLYKVKNYREKGKIH